MISVCMATYNGGKYLREQIESILRQVEEKDEVVVSDDGSTDNTLSIIKSYHDNRIKLFINERKHGFVGNFENALNKAKGDYIFLCDQDDVWTPNKVKVVLKELESCDLVVHDAELMNGDGLLMGHSYYSCMHSRTDFLSNLWKTRFLGCCMAFTKQVKDACLPFPKNTVGHDYWIGMYALTRFKVRFIPDKLLYYRRHGGNASPSSEKSDNSIYFMLVEKRLNLVLSLIKRRLF